MKTTKCECVMFDDKIAASLGLTEEKELYKNNKTTKEDVNREMREYGYKLLSLANKFHSNCCEMVELPK